MRFLSRLRQYRGWILYLAVVAAVAAWSKWDRRDMPRAASSCMTVDQIKEIDRTFAYAASRVGKTIEQKPLYSIDSNGCATWDRPQSAYFD